VGRPGQSVDGVAGRGASARYDATGFTIDQPVSRPIQRIEGRCDVVVGQWQDVVDLSLWLGGVLCIGRLRWLVRCCW